LAIVRSATSTFTDAEAAAPGPPSAEVMVDVVLFCVPPATPVTFTEKVHDALAARAAPLRATLPEPAAAVIVPPPHVPLSPFGVATTSPDGRVSVKPTDVSELAAFGLLAVKVNEVEADKLMLAAPNAFCRVGGATTVTLALAVFPVPALAEVTVTLFAFTPAEVPVTFTAIVHEPETGSVAPESETDDAPGAAVIVPLPQEPVNPFGEATCNPEGKLSVKATPVSEIVLAGGLVIVNVSDVVPFKGTVEAPKAFAMAGGVATTSVADAVPPLPPFVELTAPVVLTYVALIELVTFTVTVHELLTGTVPEDSATLPEPAVAVAVPPHVLVKPLGVATTRFTGNVSVKATPVSATLFPAGLVIVMVNALTPFGAISVGAKALLIVGAASTTCGFPVSDPVLPLKLESPGYVEVIV
jgi:hypothetical protein